MNPCWLNVIIKTVKMIQNTFDNAWLNGRGPTGNRRARGFVLV